MQIRSEVGFTYLDLKNDYGEVQNEQIFIISKSGWGKGLCGSGIAQEFYNLGAVVIVIADPKKKYEWAFQQFLPEKRYHLNELMKVGKQPKAIPVKLYAPFTFNLPTTNLPEINIFTLPIKDFTNSEFAYLAETDSETEAVSLMKNASQNMPDNAGIYGFLHYIQDLVRGKTSKKSYKADSKNFYLDATAGTGKSITDVSRYLQPFKFDYFLSSKTCPLNLDFKAILADNKHYHVFTYEFIKDEKVRDFIVLSLFTQLIENAKYMKHPVLVVIPEIESQMPYHAEGAKKFLAKPLKNLLARCRSTGRGGFSTISDNQTLGGMEEEFSDKSTRKLFGEISGSKDLDLIVKRQGYKQDIRKQLMHMDFKNSFIMQGEEDAGAFKVFFPSGMWAEPEYVFREMYANRFPEKMKSYKETIDQMKSLLKEEEEKFKEKAKRREEQEKLEIEQKKKAKEERDKENGDDSKVERAKEKIDQNKEKIIMLVGEMKRDNPEMSQREIAKKFSVDKNTIRKYLKKYEDIVAKEESKGYEERVLEDLNEQEEEIDENGDSENISQDNSEEE